MKIIITGSTGFLGRNIAETFHNEGIQTIATGRSLHIGEELQKTGIEFIPADIKEKSQLNKVFSPADIVLKILK